MTPSLPPIGPEGREIKTPGLWEEFKSLFTKTGYDPRKIAPPGHTGRHAPRRPPPPPMPPCKPSKKEWSEVEAALRAKNAGLHDAYEAYQHAKLQYEMMLKLVNTQNNSAELIDQTKRTLGPGVVRIPQPSGYKQ